MDVFSRTLVWLLAAGAVACSTSTTPAAFSRKWQDSPAIISLTGIREIDVVGDLHGDSFAAARVLSAAGLITASTPFHWTGGDRVLVVTGDVIDKGSTALPIIDLLITLEGEARLAGGQVIVTLGNHEAEFLADPNDSKSADFQNELKRRELDPKKVAAGDSVYGAWLLSRPIAALIDGWFFSHAGNSGGLSAAAIGQIFQQRIESGKNGETNGGKNGYNDPFVIGNDSILESQVWWLKSGASPPQIIDTNLAALPAAHIVFGHDPGALDFSDDPQGDRSRGEMVVRYDGRLFLVDVGMSTAVGYSDGALLRITPAGPEQAVAIFPDGTTKPLWP